MPIIVGETSSSSSASTPASSRSWSWTHHVFLNFRGGDVREGFLGHLSAALKRKGITVCEDNIFLQEGDIIFDKLMKAIDESMFAITVLSLNYATSTWCLDELQRIVERSKDRGLVFLPIFYHVPISDVRYQNNSFKEAFDKHEERFGKDSEKVTKWRDALTTVAGCVGGNSDDKKYKDEAALVESIAKRIHEKLIPKLPPCTHNLVGIPSKVESMYSLLGMGLKDVRSIGIWGMGGIGKTTIARTVFEAIQGDFEASCFLANVREVCDKNNIVQKQQELVARVNGSATPFYNEYEGRRIIQNSSCNKKILLVLDNVNEESQLENLAGRQDWFGPGSRIIITTRDLHLLKTHEVHGSYEVEGLTYNEAFKLFCLNAFKQDQPKEGYLDSSIEVVKYSGGLPLALKILGSYLCGRANDIWKSGVKKIKSVQHSKILDTLKISYEDLDLTQQNIFLDIACFFKGRSQDHVKDILEKCGCNPQIEIDVLIDRSLVTLSKEGTLEMHDLIEELGKNIVIQKYPENPGKRSRLWSKEDIYSVFTKTDGTEAIESIVLQSSDKLCCSVGAEALSNMSRLKLLDICGMKLPFGLNSLPSSLKIIRWELYPLKTLPLGEEQYELVEIVLDSREIEQLWHGIKFLEKLKNLELNNCLRLKQMPDLSALPSLEKLRLFACDSLSEVHPTLKHHKNLVVLDLSDCWGLKKFPGQLETSSLKELILDGCGRLENVPEFGECMKHLLRLSLKETTSIRELPTSLGCLVSLEELILTGCHNLVCLPDTIHELKSLRILGAEWCVNLKKLPSSLSHVPFLSSLDLSHCRLTEKEFPLDFCHFPSLMKLNLSYNYFVSIPIHIHKFPMLRNLWLKTCLRLRSLPELPPSIRELDARRCESLDTTEFNLLSKACSVFASPSQDHDQVFQMLITMKEIPSWFTHHEQGNCVSIPLQNDLPQNERLGIASCFRAQPFDTSFCKSSMSLNVYKGKRFITKMITNIERDRGFLYILYLGNGYFGKEIQLDNQFELLNTFPKGELKILSSAARWMHKQDIEDLKKISETENSNENYREDVIIEINELKRKLLGGCNNRNQ